MRHANRDRSVVDPLVKVDRRSSVGATLSCVGHAIALQGPPPTWPEQCEKCGGKLKIVAALSAPEQDDIIRAILESTGQWNPPWDRRGPPPARTAASADSSEPTVDYEVEYDVDPDALWPDD